MICSRNAAKDFSLITNFPTNIFLSGVRRDICTSQFLDTQELDSLSTLKANISIFLYFSVRKFLFQRRSEISSGEGRLNNFLKATGCFCLVKCLHFFILIETFGNSTIFQHFCTSSYSIKILKLSRQFGLQG